ncbi:phosphotransacetylase [Hydrogenispora ethanolica]|uniref:Phosphate acetyltransferase n=1 Tax=Hydrogenispora ethanolica TaxID=1082276 RepID=A0A4R1REL5_HYDET|nr:phosphate acetyltransferase [Hydrogenispora ethanolica]TCL64289.1 phosphotransacetylase [Hydrogenispora ethanolica]
MDFLQVIKEKASAAQRRIILPESGDSRVLKAARQIVDQKLARITLIGEERQLPRQASDLRIDLSDLEIIEPAAHPKREQYVKTLYQLRREKGLSLDEARELLNNPLYFGTMMVYCGDMDGMVAGSISTTGNVLRPALQIIKTERRYQTVSGAFLIFVPDCILGEHGLFVFADCAVNVNPDSRTLAEIGIQAGHTARNLANFEPVISFLSFSTQGSASHEMVDKVREAVQIAREMEPSWAIDGEFQADAALIPAVGRQKAPGSPVAGKANVLVFPDLQSGNIGYKLVERLAKAVAIGPILQGMAKPVNDLSRGCNSDDIVNMVAITAVQAQATIRP